MPEFNLNVNCTIGSGYDVTMPLILINPFTEATIDFSDWTHVNYVFNNNNYGYLIKKDPIVINSIGSVYPLQSGVHLYSYDSNLSRLDGTLSNYTLQLWIYPMIDLYALSNYSISVQKLKEVLGIDNNYRFRELNYARSYTFDTGTYGIPYETTSNTILSKVLGTGKEAVKYGSTGTDHTESHSYPAVYDIDTSKLGINTPSDIERGINEETLQLFNKNNILEYRDQRLVNYASTISYYLNMEELIKLDIYRDSTATGGSYALRLFSKLSSIARNNVDNYNDANPVLYYNKCIFNPFSNLAVGDGRSPAIILTGLKKIVEA